MDDTEVRGFAPKATKNSGDVVYMRLTEAQRNLMKDKGVDQFVFNNMIDWTIVSIDENSGNYVMKPVNKPELGLTWGDKTYTAPIEVINKLNDERR